jgi:hypothetical protein
MPSSDRVTVRRSGKTFDRRRAANALDRNEHGTAGYALGCRCVLCRSAARTSERVRRAERAVLVGREPLYWRTVPEAMTEHVAALRARGWSLRAISAAAGLHPDALGRALRKGSTSSHTVNKVLGVE